MHCIHVDILTYRQVFSEMVHSMNPNSAESKKVNFPHVYAPTLDGNVKSSVCHSSAANLCTSPTFCITQISLKLVDYNATALQKPMPDAGSTVHLLALM